MFFCTYLRSKVTQYNYEFVTDGILVTVTNAAKQTATTKYDLYGRVEYTTDFGGIKTEYKYGDYDRVETVTIGSDVTTYTYDPKGNVTEVEGPSGTIKYDYNALGYLTCVTNAKGEKISYDYNDGYQLSKISIDNQDISYGYDKQGRLISVTDSKGTTKYAYDENGNRKSTTYPNGLVTTYEYNNINALVKQVTKNKNGTVIASYEYEIGKNGERTKVTELGRTVEYEYDKLNRLTKETVTRGTAVSTTSYAYDKNSNRTSMTKDGTVTTYVYNDLNQITRAGNINYTWDEAGNLVSQTTTTGVLVASYTYDSQNRMVSANVSSNSSTIVETYEYDYLGNRTAKTSNGVKTEYTTDLSTGYSQVLKAKTASDSVYYTRGFELIARKEGSSASYYIYDGGLSVRALTNEAGAVTDTLVFDAFGNETEKNGTTGNSYGFQGEEKDETGLYYLRARYMDPSTGTFTSLDTYGGSLSDPMSLHKYLFANSNPVSYCDPSGHFSLVEFELSEAIDEILMSSLSFGMAYIGMVADNPNMSDQEKVAGYIAALGLGALFPFGVALLNAILPVLVAALVLATVSLILTLISTFGVDHDKDPVTGALLDIVAGAAWGAAISNLGLAFKQNARNSRRLIHIDADPNATGDNCNWDNIDQEIEEWSWREWTKESGQAGRGQSKGGKHIPTDLNEQLAMQEAISNPSAGKQGVLNDKRWNSMDGWVKMFQNINGYEVHYVYNPITGEVDDVKIK